MRIMCSLELAMAAEVLKNMRERVCCEDISVTLSLFPYECGEEYSVECLSNGNTVTGGRKRL